MECRQGSRSHPGQKQRFRGLGRGMSAFPGRPSASCGTLQHHRSDHAESQRSRGVRACYPAGSGAGRDREGAQCARRQDREQPAARGRLCVVRHGGCSIGPCNRANRWMRRWTTSSEFQNRRRRPSSAAERLTMPGDIPYYGATGAFDRVRDHLFDEVLLLVGEDRSVVRGDGTLADAVCVSGSVLGQQSRARR